MADTPYFLIGVFDKYQAHLKGFSVWLIHKGHCELKIDAACSPIRKSAVNADGLIYPEYSKLFYPRTDTQPPYWLKTYLLQEFSTNSRSVMDEDGKEIGTIQWSTIQDDSTL